MGVIQTEIIIMFVMMAVGFVCGKVGLIDGEANKKLSNLSLLLVNPLLTFMSYQTEYSSEIAKNLLYTLLASGVVFVIHVGVAVIVVRKKRPEFAIERMSLIFSNSGYIGIPLVQSVFGMEGDIYLTVFITVFNVLVWTLGVSMMKGERGVSLSGTLKNLCTPAIIAIVLGIILFFLRVKLPELVAQPIASIGNMNTPLAMLIAGATLAGCKLKECLKKPILYLLSAVRLLVIPAICALCLVMLRHVGVGDMQISIVIIAAACPSAAITTMFAHRYGRNSSYASELFAVTTLFSVVTIPLIMKFMSLLGVSV